MTDLSFKATVSKQGDRLVIIIPKALYQMLLTTKGKEVLVHIEDVSEEIAFSGK